MSMIPNVALGGMMSSLQSIAITDQWCTRKKGERKSVGEAALGDLNNDHPPTKPTALLPCNLEFIRILLNYVSHNSGNPWRCLLGSLSRGDGCYAERNLKCNFLPAYFTCVKTKTCCEILWSSLGKEYASVKDCVTAAT